MRRVVITGLGMVSPLACGVEETWKRLIAGESGAGRIEAFEVSDLPCQIACMIPRGDGTNGTFNADQWMDPKDQRKVDDFIIYGVSAATQALKDANWVADTPEKQEGTGVLIGSGIGGLGGIYEASVTLKEKGPRRVSPFFVSGRIINLVAGYVSILHGLKGPNHAVVTACATGTHAIGDAARIIAQGIAGPLGQPVIVDNRANGLIGSEVVARSPPDGYTLLVTGSSLWLFLLLHGSVSYDPVRDFTLVSLATLSPTLLVIHPSLAAKTVAQLIARQGIPPDGSGPWIELIGSAGGSAELRGRLRIGR